MKKYIVYGFFVLGMLLPFISSAEVTGDYDPNPNASVCVSINNNLRYQARDISTNGEVSTLQDFLQSKGYLNSEPTGYFGLLTMKAVKSFQSASGISPTGYVGPLTRAKIKSVSCSGQSVVSPNEPMACTMDVKQCADGSYVGRTGPMCEFAKCVKEVSTCSSSGYDTRTGLLCGCNSASGYSYTTGKYCGKTKTYLPGCTSNSGFSSTTGESCDGSRPPTIEYPSGCTSALGWSTTTGLACDGSKKTEPVLSNCASGQGGFDYKTGLPCGVEIPSTPVSTCSAGGYDSQTGLPCGCTSNSGWSTTTGESCGTNTQPEILITSFTSALGGLNGPVRVGDTMDIFGANFNSNAGIIIDNIGEGYYGLLKYISPSHLNFVVPSNLSIGAHSIEVSIPGPGQSAIISNAVNFKVINNYPAGCSSASGFSYTTGEPCS